MSAIEGGHWPGDAATMLTDEIERCAGHRYRIGAALENRSLRCAFSRFSTAC